jgi:hypothetical protein
MLRLEEYGGICDESVGHMCQLVDIYQDRAKPEHFRDCIIDINLRDFCVMTFYFNVVAMLDVMQFVPLSAEMVQSTDNAMMNHKLKLYPGQPVPENAYHVTISLCCNRICTLMGTGKHGDKKVAYDIEQEAYVCALKLPAGSACLDEVSLQENDDEENDDDDDSENDDDDEEDENDEDIANDTNLVSGILDAQYNEDLDLGLSEWKTGQFVVSRKKSAQRKAKRSQVKENAKLLRLERKAWCRLPCGQPVITINLRGRALVWGTLLEKMSMYMHCPSCAGLHMFTILNYSGSETGAYRCTQCARKELMHLPYRSCAFCQQDNPLQVPADSWLNVPSEHGLERLYFCKMHHRMARPYCVGVRLVLKPELMKILKAKQAARTLNVARGIYKK